MKIGILGGSFNPPHKMHLEIARELINKQYVDKVIYVPTGSKYKYKNNLLPDKNRLEMLQIATKNDDFLEVSDYELKEDVVYTYETLDYFKKLYPEDLIYFICGTDNLSYMDKWKNGLEILSNYKILVIKRDTDNIDDILNKFKKYKDNIIISDVEPNAVSSTEIRNKLKNDDSVDGLIDEEVLKYIKRNDLYREY